jgi:hypothetical protein
MVGFQDSRFGFPFFLLLRIVGPTWDEEALDLHAWTL